MKLGVVLEGGASRAYFTAGALDAFLELSIYPDYVIGSSAGIANAISYVSRQKGRNYIIGTKYLSDKRYMGIKHLLNPFNRSLYNKKFVFHDIPNKHILFDYDAFKNSGCKTYAAITNIETGECEYKLIDGEDKSWTSTVASCALPLFFQPVKIDGKLYMDGGIANPIPFEKAINDGCDKVIVILTRQRDYIKFKESGLDICCKLYKNKPNFVNVLKNRTDIYNETHKKVVEYEKEGKLFLLAPENTDGWNRTERNPEKIKEIYYAGYNAAMDNKDALLEYLKK